MTSLWNLPVFRLIAADRCRVAAPWFAWSRGNGQAATLRRRANALERRKLGADSRWEQTLAALLYVPVSAPRLLRATWQWGRQLHAADRVSFFRQCFDVYNCAWRLGLRPQVYYYLRLHEQRRNGRWQQVIDPSELHHLQRDISPTNHEPLQNKLLFTQRAVEHGLPAVPLLALWRDGELVQGGEASSLERDLFVKRAESYGSIGVMAFRYNASTGAHYDEDRRYTPAELAALLRRESQGRTLLVQPRLRNHDALAGFSPGGLCNYRVVTGRHLDGRTQVLLAALRFPLESTVTCAEQDTTLCAAVDLITGRLHAAESKHPGLGRCAVHPVTGGQIEGFAVPRLAEILDLATRAHAAWPDFPFIGWDITDTTDGVFLLEGGFLWGGFLAQMSGSPPLGLTPFASIYAEHLAARSN